MPRASRVPTCHPDRPHCAKGLCRPCYYKAKNYKQDPAKIKAWGAARYAANPARAKTHALAWQKANREKYQLIDAKRRAADPEKQRRKGADWYANNPTKYLGYEVGRYGLTRAEFEALKLSQGGVCAGCLRTCASRRRLSVDHDHRTGKVRGLLCMRCNSAVGYAKDNPETLRRLATYLEAAR